MIEFNIFVYHTSPSLLIEREIMERKTKFKWSYGNVNTTLDTTLEINWQHHQSNNRKGVQETHRKSRQIHQQPIINKKTWYTATIISLFFIFLQLPSKRVGVIKNSVVEEYIKSINSDLHTKFRKYYVETIEDAFTKLRYISLSKLQLNKLCKPTYIRWILQISQPLLQVCVLVKVHKK